MGRLSPFLFRIIVIRAFSLLILLVAAAIPGVPQSVPNEVPAVPIEQEPRHRLVFTNEFVRILDVVLPPLYVSQNHTHIYDSVAITILPGIDGPAGQARIGFAGYSRGGYSHTITNQNMSPMRIVAVELRGADRGSADEIPQDGHVPVLANARVRITRVTLGARESIAEHQHANGYVSVVVRGGEGAGAWKWNPSGEPAALLNAGTQPLEIVEVEPR